MSASPLNRLDSIADPNFELGQLLNSIYSADASAICIYIDYGLDDPKAIDQNPVSAL